MSALYRFLQVKSIPLTINYVFTIQRIAMAKGSRTLTEQDKQDSDHFRRRLQELLDARGLTAAGLAKMAGTTPRTLYRILQEGADPTRGILVAIARALGVSIDSLAIRSPSETTDNSSPHLLIAERVLEMAFGKPVIGRLSSEELGALLRRIGDVLRALEGPFPMSDGRNRADVCRSYVPVVRATVSALYEAAGGDFFLQHDLNPLNRACVALEFADWEATKARVVAEEKP